MNTAKETTTKPMPKDKTKTAPPLKSSILCLENLESSMNLNENDFIRGGAGVERLIEVTGKVMILIGDELCSVKVVLLTRGI